MFSELRDIGRNYGWVDGKQTIWTCETKKKKKVFFVRTKNDAIEAEESNDGEL